MQPFRSSSFAVLAVMLATGCGDDGAGPLPAEDAAAPSVPPDGASDAAVGDDAGVDAGDGDAAAPVVIECDPPTGGPTEHMGTVDTETWTAAGSPHLVPNDLAVTGTLTLEPCAEVLLGSLSSLDAVAGGAFVANGTATMPIHIGAIDEAEPFFRIGANGGGTLRFVHTTIDGGGDPWNAASPDLTAMVYAQGEDGTQPTQAILFVDHVTMEGSRSNGVRLQDGAGFAPGSTDLVITGSANYPISITPRAIDGIPTGRYTGNTIDEIVLPGAGGTEAIQEDHTTMHNRGVPYRVGDSIAGGVLEVGKQEAMPSGVAVLTIEPGVTVRVRRDGVIQVQRLFGDSPAAGAIVAVGTPDEPIVFTSAEGNPTAGDWLGIWFGMVPDAGNKMEYVRVEYAGGLSSTGSGACNTPGTNDAAIRIFGPPAGQFVKYSTILDSAGHGIDRGWSDDFQPDFLPTNTFTRIAGCNQSEPSATTGACPSTVPCAQ